MYTFSNEQEFKHTLVMYLDGALNSEDARDFLSEVRNSPKYLAELQKEQSFREFLRKKVHRKEVSPALVARIKSQLSTGFRSNELSETS